jgi:hypothetical protein
MNGHSYQRRRSRSDTGAAIVEFSIVAMVLAVALSLLIDIGQLIFLKMSISHVTLQVARDLSVLLPESARDDSLGCEQLKERANEIIAAQDYTTRYEILVPEGVEFHSVSVISDWGIVNLPSLSVKGELSEDFRCLFCFMELASLRPQFTATVTIEIEGYEATC